MPEISMVLLVQHQRYRVYTTAFVVVEIDELKSFEVTEDTRASSSLYRVFSVCISIASDTDSTGSDDWVFFNVSTVFVIDEIEPISTTSSASCNILGVLIENVSLLLSRTASSLGRKPIWSLELSSRSLAIASPSSEFVDSSSSILLAQESIKRCSFSFRAI